MDVVTCACYRPHFGYIATTYEKRQNSKYNEFILFHLQPSKETVAGRVVVFYISSKTLLNLLKKYNKIKRVKLGLATTSTST